jgi:hypothetical protein
MQMRLGAALDQDLAHLFAYPKQTPGLEPQAIPLPDTLRDKVSIPKSPRQETENLFKSKLEAARKQHQAASKQAGEEPAAASKEKMVEVRFKPQDDVLPPTTIQIPQSEIGTDCHNARFKVQEDPAAFRPPTADKDGNYIFNLDDPRQSSVNAFVSAKKALDIAQKYLGRNVTWAFKREVDHDRLWIHPHAGEGLNAFYSNPTGTINFLYAEDPHTNSVVDAASSLEVVSHETGHAILDGLRPLYLESMDTSSGGFHEAFGDVVAMLASLSEPDVLDALYQETGGNLSKSNIVSRMGEQLGKAMKGEKAPYVRNALNDQKYKDSHYLPFINFEGGPGLEPHAYSSVWTGANYDIFRVLVAKQRDDSSKPFVEAVKDARDTLGKLAMRSIEFAPIGKINYKEAAIAMLKADAIDNEGENMKTLLAVFVNRDIMTQDDAEKFMTDIAMAKVLGETGKMSLPEDFDVKSKSAGKKFLEEKGPMLGMSASDIKGMKYIGCVTTDKGEKILQYQEDKKVTLTEPEWGASLQGNSFTLHGGLVLAFDKDNKLTTFNHDEITDDNVEEAKHFLHKMMDFQKNPPIIIRRGGSDDEEGAAKKDYHTEYLLASTKNPIEISNGEIKRTGIIYCGEGHANCSGH